MKLLLLLAAVALANSPGSRSASCTTNVEGYPLPTPPLAPNHYVVAVGKTFQATFSFNSDSSSWVIEKGSRHFAPGTLENPNVGNLLRQPSFEFVASYECAHSIGHTPKDAPDGFVAEHLKFEYGTAFPDSATCDTEFECCDVGCEIISEFDATLPPNPALATSNGMYGVEPMSWGGSACAAGVDACVPCGVEFNAQIKIFADCPDAEVTAREITTSGARINGIDRTLRDWDRLNIFYQCPEKRGSTHEIEIEVTDQYGGVDTCGFVFECQWCPNSCTCPMCAPDQKEWICYNDREGDFNLVAVTEHERENIDPGSWVYPLEHYPDWENGLGTQLDCWCDPICEMPPAGLTFVCHHDRARSQYFLAAVHTESREGPMNDLGDYLAAGDGFPGTHIDGDFFDCWCNVIA